MGFIRKKTHQHSVKGVRGSFFFYPAFSWGNLLVVSGYHINHQRSNIIGFVDTAVALPAAYGMAYGGVVRLRSLLRSFAYIPTNVVSCIGKLPCQLYSYPHRKDSEVFLPRPVDGYLYGGQFTLSSRTPTLPLAACVERRRSSRHYLSSGCAQELSLHLCTKDRTPTTPFIPARRSHH